jgi:XapX domain-containing protein
MKAYLLSLGVGFLVGVIYSVLGVRSPAPPVIALIGLLGILAGEQTVPFAQRLTHDRFGVVNVGERVKDDARAPLQAKASPQSSDADAHRP